MRQLLLHFLSITALFFTNEMVLAQGTQQKISKRDSFHNKKLENQSSKDQNALAGITMSDGNKNLKDEHEIRQLEEKWPLLLEKSDTIGLKKILSETYVVNNVNGSISTRRQILDLVKTGRVFPRVERTIDQITINGTVAIVMGSETEISSNPQNKDTKRRFTNTWSKQRSDWKLIARQASNVCQKNTD